jgi:hypothetical protein
VFTRLDKVVLVDDEPSGMSACKPERKVVGYFDSAFYLRQAIDELNLTGSLKIVEIPDDDVFQIDRKDTPSIPEVKQGDPPRHFYILCYPVSLGGWILDWMECGADQVTVERLDMNTYRRPDGTLGGPKTRNWFYQLTIKADET